MIYNYLSSVMSIIIIHLGPPVYIIYPHVGPPICIINISPLPRPTRLQYNTNTSAHLSNVLFNTLSLPVYNNLHLGPPVYVITSTLGIPVDLIHIYLGTPIYIISNYLSPSVYRILMSIGPLIYSTYSPHGPTRLH